jgi:phosphoribosylanthranilate isomerase
MKAITRPESAKEWPAQVMLLFDAHDPVKRGGTGRVVDWTTAATVARERRIVLAGGLTPDNVADAVAAVQPFGIDVSSGVELSPGIKDERRMAALFAAIQRSRVSTV